MPPSPFLGQSWSSIDKKQFRTKSKQQLNHSWLFKGTGLFPKGAVAAMALDEVAPPPAPSPPRREECAEAVIKHPKKCRFFCEPAGPWCSFSIRLKVWPMGKHRSYTSDAGSTSEESSQWEDCLAAVVQVLPPRNCPNKWVCPDVEVELEVRNFKDESLHVRRLWKKTFCEKSSSVGARPLLPSRHLTADEGWCNADDELFVTAKARFQAAPDPLHTMLFAKLDFSEEASQVVFKLKEEPLLFFDKRILVARSEYFKTMFESQSWLEGRTNEVDLSKDPLADRRTILAMFRYLMSNTFSAAGDFTWALSVRQFADRYGMADFVERIDSELIGLVSRDNLLVFLGHVHGKGGQLESFCLEVLKEKTHSVIDRHKSKLDQLLQEKPELAKTVILHLMQRDNKESRKRSRSRRRSRESRRR